MNCSLVPGQTCLCQALMLPAICCALTAFAYPLRGELPMWCLRLFDRAIHARQTFI